MRDVSRKVCGAFLARTPANGKNTRTDGKALYLHGNKIAWWDGYMLCLTMAGWPTVTTRERLNALCELYLGRRPFYQRGGEQYYARGVFMRRHEPISPSDTIAVEAITFFEEDAFEDAREDFAIAA